MVLAENLIAVKSATDTIDPAEEDRYQNLCIASAQFTAKMEDLNTDNTTTTLFSQVVSLDTGGYAHIFGWKITENEE